MWERGQYRWLSLFKIGSPRSQEVSKLLCLPSRIPPTLHGIIAINQKPLMEIKWTRAFFRLFLDSSEQTNIHLIDDSYFDIGVGILGMLGCSFLLIGISAKLFPFDDDAQSVFTVKAFKPIQVMVHIFSHAYYSLFRLQLWQLLMNRILWCFFLFFFFVVLPSPKMFLKFCVLQTKVHKLIAD